MSDAPGDLNTPPPPPNHEGDATNIDDIRETLSETAIAESPNDDDDDDDDDDDNSDDNNNDDGDEDDDMMAMLPANVVRRVEKLKELHEEREKIIEEYLTVRAELERKYVAKCRPLYDERLKIITGKRDDDIAAAAAAAAGNGDLTAGAADNDPVAGIPQFWVCAMGHMETIAELITEQDVDCLEHLIDVTCDDFPDGKGFTLLFHFQANDYFEDEVLSKRYEIPNLLLDDEPILKNVVGCDIKWKPGRSLTSREIQKKQRSKSGKRAGQIRTVTKIERTDSFFHFFNPPKMPSLEDMDEEEADAIEEAFDHDYDVAQSFRSHLIPKAVQWFTGQALDEEVENLIEEIEDDSEH